MPCWGAIAAGDIGELFPNSDPQWKDAPSRIFLETAYAQAQAAGYRLANADITILAERPRLKAFKLPMRQFLAEVLCVPTDCINLKAGTNEGCDAIGRGRGDRRARSGVAGNAICLAGRFLSPFPNARSPLRMNG